jgi:hypothetical protein
MMLGVCASASSATVYKWVDDNGVVHYSDQPNPKAQKLQISDAQTYPAQAAAVTGPAGGPAPSAATPVCVINSPGAGQVFLDTFSITGHVTLGRVGGEGSQTTLHMDGQDISGLLGADGSFALSQVERGDHTLALQVTNARGEVTCQSTVTFSIRQRNAAVPGAPTAPGAPAAPRAPGAGVVH